MKKLFYTAAALFLFIATMVSCGDNDDFSKPHVLTAEEIETMRIQDSIAEAAKNTINANLVLTYDVVLNPDPDLYAGKNVDVDMQAIADLFGMSKEDLLNGLLITLGEDVTGPSITVFCIQGSTHADNMSGSNTNSWGHWFNADGDLTDWAGTESLAYVYTEYDFDDETMYVAQYPGRIEIGQKITIIEGLKYQDMRVAIVFNISVEEEAGVEATIVNTQNLEITLPQNPASYDPTGLKFDLAQTLSDIGASSLSDENLVTYDADGKLVQSLNADCGFWMDKNGYKGSWGEDAGAWLSYGMEGIAEDEIGVCLMPGANEEGDVYVMEIGFLNNNKIELLHITINVGAATVIEAEVVGRQDLEVSVAPDNNYLYTATAVPFDLAKTLADTGLTEITTSNLTAYDMDGNLMTYCNADGGFWYDKSGPVGSWGDDASVWISYGLTDDPATIGVAPMPGATAVGEVYEHDFYIVNEDKMEQLHITVYITEYEDPEDKPGTTPADAEVDVELNIEWADWWPDDYFDVRDLVRNAFNLTTHEVMEALNNDELKVYLNEIGDGVPAYNANHGEYWINAEGQIDEVGYPDAPYYTGFYTDGTTYIEVGAGINSDVVANEAATCSYKLIALYQGHTVTFNITLNLTPGEETPAEAPARKMVRESKAGKFYRR